MSKTIIHPGWDSPRGFPFRHDVALVRLEMPAVLNVNVQTVCLPSDEEVGYYGAVAFLDEYPTSFPSHSLLLKAVAAELDLPDLSSDSLSGLYATVVGWGRQRFNKAGLRTVTATHTCSVVPPA